MKVKIKQIEAKSGGKFITSDSNKNCESVHDFNALALPFAFTNDNPTITNVSDAINLIWSTLKSASPTADEVITQDMEANGNGIITTSLELVSLLNTPLRVIHWLSLLSLRLIILPITTSLGVRLRLSTLRLPP